MTQATDPGLVRPRQGLTPRLGVPYGLSRRPEWAIAAVDTECDEEAN